MSEVDIVTCLAKPYEESVVPLRRCMACGLGFYPESLSGSARLYEELGKLEYYYPSEKWEFQLALQDIMSARSVLEIGCGMGVFLERAASCPP